jgi:oxygen-dependent protoporphyrinogen oxidase
VGGGVAGLSVAFEILDRARGRADAPEIVCLEAETRPGGNIHSDESEGYLTEWGPNGFLDNVPATLDLARRLGISDRLLPADPSSHDRFLFRRGRLRKLPTGPLSFLASGVLSLWGRLRVLGEPFGPGPKGDGDESVHDFAARRIGPEAARALVGAMVTGIYAGDARQLSLRSTFPKMWHMEREYGTLLRALWHKRRQARAQGTTSGGPAGPGGRLTSFEGGLETLIQGLARAVGPALRTGTKVEGLETSPEGFRVRVMSGEPFDASAVVLACPAWHAAEATGSLDAKLSSVLTEIPSASLAVVHLGFEDARLPRKPTGFGFLVPRGEGPRILGTIWASSIFPGRAPPGRSLLTTMVGGAQDPDAAGLPEDELVRIVREDLRRCMEIEAAPCFVRIYRHPRGIPQYTIGHGKRLEAVGKRLEAHPGLFVAGNSYRGISVNNCADEAPRIAEEVLGFVTRRGRPS